MYMYYPATHACSIILRRHMLSPRTGGRAGVVPPQSTKPLARRPVLYHLFLNNRYGIIPGHDGPDLLADPGREHLAPSGVPGKKVKLAQS